jgi:hypothetical protein
MAFLPIPDTVQVRFSGHTGAANRPWTFGLYFYMPDFDESDVDDLLDYLEGWSDDLMNDQVWTGYGLDSMVATDLGSEDGLKKVRALSATGDRAGMTPTAMSNSLVVSFSGNKRGKWNTGRVYLPLVVEADADEYDISSAWADGIRDVFRQLMTELPAGWVWCVASRYLHGEQRPAGVIAAVVDCVIKKYVFGTQRRRLRRNKA